MNTFVARRALCMGTCGCSSMLLMRLASTTSVARASIAKGTTAPPVPEKHAAGHEEKDDWFWPHPVYNREDLLKIQIAHREAKSKSDRVALAAVSTMRWCFDKATGYKHSEAIAKGEQKDIVSSQTNRMTTDMWLARIIYLESVAGVPGMVGAMLRHLRSIRLLRKDEGWIETLLEESVNERMHLLTFLAIRKPGFLMRTMILFGQGVFTNFLFFTYLIHPRTVHRFVGYLEEEAVITYSRLLADMDAGLLPEWDNMDAPPIAKAYWKLGKDAKFKDVLLAVRNDESKHREVNHTLANLKASDPAPFTHRLEGDEGRIIHKPAGHRPHGWERQEVIPDEIAKGSKGESIVN